MILSATVMVQFICMLLVSYPCRAEADSLPSLLLVDPLPPGLNIPPALQPSFASAFTEDPIPPLKLLTQPILIKVGRTLPTDRLKVCESARLLASTPN